MIEAILHGKLSRQQENLEDLLTSAVFGRLKLLPAHVLGAFLARAQTLQGARPLEPLASPRSVEYAFWPQLRAAGCDDTEPDVLLTVHAHAGAARRVLVEAKYRSGKSSRAAGDEEPGADVVSPGERRIRDQLAREWEHLSNLDPEGWVVYLTPSFVMPRSDLVEAQDELRARNRTAGRFCWLSWRELERLEYVDPVTAELRRLLVRLGLRAFHGIGRLGPIHADWSFTKALWRAKTEPAHLEATWRFDRLGARRWQWSSPGSLPGWRFVE